jgi:hypothetical protein
MFGKTKVDPIEPKQNDTGSRFLDIALYTYNDVEYIIPFTATSVELVLTRFDGQTFRSICTNISNNRLTAPLVSDMLKVAGTAKAHVYIKDGTTDIRSQSFLVDVNESVSPNDIDLGTNDLTMYEQKLNELSALNTQITTDEANRNTAETNRTTTYNNLVTQTNTMITTKTNEFETAKNDELAKVDQEFKAKYDTLETEYATDLSKKQQYDTLETKTGTGVTSLISQDSIAIVQKVEGLSTQVVTTQGKNLLDKSKLENGGIDAANGANVTDSPRIRTGN